VTRLITILCIALCGCDAHTQTTDRQTVTEACWRIQHVHPTPYPALWSTVWETRNTPIPMGAGYYFLTDAGNPVFVSGSVTIERTTRRVSK
jgi:hypothetical protein